MIVDWADSALADLDRLTGFLEDVAPAATAVARQTLLNAPKQLLDFPRVGSPLPNYAPLEVRRVGPYELRYELLPGMIRIIRVWHMREDRPFDPES